MSPPHENPQHRESPGQEPGFVLSELCRLCPAEPEGAGVAREIRADIEAQSLAAWFDERGLLASRSEPGQGLAPASIGPSLPSMTNQPPLFTARVARDGEWFVAFSLEFPEANGQGRTEGEALESLRESIALLIEDRR